jgi:hypothetical protein
MIEYVIAGVVLITVAGLVYKSFRKNQANRDKHPLEGNKTFWSKFWGNK